MNKNVSINVKTLGLGVTCNLLVPRDMLVSNAIVMMLRIIKDEYPGVSTSQPEKTSLIHSSTGMVLDRNVSIGRLGFQDGETLILV